MDLTARTAEAAALDEGDVGRFLGGAGLNAWLLYREVGPATAPLAPESPLVFGAGPLVGTSFPASARSTFTALSPLTGLFGDANGGGYFGPMVKRAGYDHVVIRGAADAPCYLLVEPGGRVSVRDARDLWGLDAVTCDHRLTEAHPGSAVACIGPAGENLVAFANILTHGGANSWSRTGVGAVMGSKKLKAIVVKGSAAVPVASPRELDELSRRLKGEAEVSYGGRLMSRWGTMQHLTAFPAMGLLYRHNGRHAVTVKEAAAIGVESFLATTEASPRGCFRCPLKCERSYRIKEGRFAGETGPKYELGFGCCLGFNLGIDDLPGVLHLSNLCNRIGVDLIEFGSVAGLVIDLARQGILGPADTDGISLDWGSTDAVEELARKVAAREGIGAIVADGVVKAAERVGRGAGQFIIQMKGMSEPAHSCPLFILAFAVSTRGGDHLKGMPILCLNAHNLELARAYFDATPRSMDLFDHADKGRVIWWHENYKTAVDSLGTCFFLTSSLLPMGFLLPDQLAEAWRLATGRAMTGDELLLAGERAYQVEKALNARRGVDRSRDAFTRRPEPDAWGHDVDLSHPGMLDEYYAYRGCSADGLPLKTRLAEVGLDGVAADLEREGRLGGQPGAYRPVRRGRVEARPGNPVARAVQRLVMACVTWLLHSPRVVELLTRASVLRYQAERAERKRLASRPPASP